MGRAGFGIDFGWPFGSMEEEKSADSSDVPHDKFYVAASSILNNWIPLAFLPKIFLRPFPLTNYIKRAAAGQEVFEKELRQVVAKRVEEVKFVGKNGSEDKHDILTLLCRANVLEDSKSKLSDEELCESIRHQLGPTVLLSILPLRLTRDHPVVVSDAFVFLIAGHGSSLPFFASTELILSRADVLALQKLRLDRSPLSLLFSRFTPRTRTPSSKKSRLISKNPVLNSRTPRRTVPSPSRSPSSRKLYVLPDPLKVSFDARLYLLNSLRGSSVKTERRPKETTSRSLPELSFVNTFKEFTTATFGKIPSRSSPRGSSRRERWGNR
jgi:hypothetical protein